MLLCLFPWAVLVLLWGMSDSPNPNLVRGVQAALALLPRDIPGGWIHILHGAGQGSRFLGKRGTFPAGEGISTLAAGLVPPPGAHLASFKLLNIFVSQTSRASLWLPNKPQAGAAELRDGLIPHQHPSPSSGGNERSFRRRGTSSAVCALKPVGTGKVLRCHSSSL